MWPAVPARSDSRHLAWTGDLARCNQTTHYRSVQYTAASIQPPHNPTDGACTLCFYQQKYVRSLKISWALLSMN
jgi:hypothetical protein